MREFGIFVSRRSVKEHDTRLLEILYNSTNLMTTIDTPEVFPFLCPICIRHSRIPCVTISVFFFFFREITVFVLHQGFILHLLLNTVNIYCSIFVTLMVFWIFTCGFFLWFSVCYKGTKQILVLFLLTACMFTLLELLNFKHLS